MARSLGVQTPGMPARDALRCSHPARPTRSCSNLKRRHLTVLSSRLETCRSDRTSRVGRFLEVVESNTTVETADGRTRSALTHIYFALDSGEVSRFHKVASDEVWNLYCGTGVYLHVWNGSDKPPETIELWDHG